MYSSFQDKMKEAIPREPTDIKVTQTNLIRLNMKGNLENELKDDAI